MLCSAQTQNHWFYHTADHYFLYKTIQYSKIFRDRTQSTCNERYLKGEVAYFQTRQNMAYHDHLRFPGAFSFWTIGFILFSPACFGQHHAFHYLHFRGQAAALALLYCIDRFPEPVVRLEPQVIDHVQVVGLEDLTGGSTQEGQHHRSKVKHCGRFCEKKRKEKTHVISFAQVCP